MLADRIKMSSERFHPPADSDRGKTPRARQWMELEDSSRGIEERIVGPKGTGRPTEPTNLDPWGSQSLNQLWSMPRLLEPSAMGGT